MVYSAFSDDSSTVSQFTRRKKITITTDGTSTPANYQCKLTITYESEMQTDFDDLRFNTKAGTYIDYWIESYTASTTAIVWVELPDAITNPESDYIWMYYGNPNLNDGGVGADTFLSHFDGDSTGWTEVDPNSHIAFNNNRLEFTGLTRGEDAYVYQSNANVNNNVIIENSFYITSYTAAGFVSMPALTDMVDDANNFNNGIGTYRIYSTPNALPFKRITDTPTYGTGISISTTTQYWTTSIINRSGNIDLKIYSDSTRTTQVGSTSSLDVSDVSATLNKVMLLSSYNTGNSSYTMTGWLDDFHIRKYIVNEPTPSYGTAQHQRRISQFIG